MPGNDALLPPRSILRYDRTAEPAEAVVQAGQREAHALTDGVVARDRERRCGPRNIARTHEEMVVFQPNGPVRCEAEFDAGPNHATPTGFARIVDLQAARRKDAGISVVSDRGAAFHIQQQVVPAVADLAGEKADGVDRGLVGEGLHRQPLTEV